jgi:hypothetical protein
MENRPPYRELWDRVEAADDWACNGGFQDSDCRFCKEVVKVLRGGHVFCPECGHVNAIGHSCDQWNPETGEWVGPDWVPPSE